MGITLWFLSGVVGGLLVFSGFNLEDSNEPGFKFLISPLQLALIVPFSGLGPILFIFGIGFFINSVCINTDKGIRFSEWFKTPKSISWPVNKRNGGE